MLAEIAIWLPPASTTAVRVDLLTLALNIICGSVGLLIACLLFYF